MNEESKNLLSEIRKMLDERFDAIDQRFAEQDKRFDAFDERFVEQDKQFRKMLDDRFAEQNAQLERKLDKRFAESENMLLGEIERTRAILEQKIDRVQSDVDTMKQYYRITRLEDSNTALLLEHVAELDMRVERLEKKMA